MGNCLVPQDKVVRVMKNDGKILEYQEPIKVHQVLSEFSGHALSDSFPGCHHLQPDAKLLSGHLYYLIPLPLVSQKVKKKVRFSNPEADGEQGTGVVRIKLVISKQELRKMLQKEGVSVPEMISKAQSRKSESKIDMSEGDDNCRGWKPVLESISEVN
ncbi:hypothetical protein SLE2022_124360 [Rubroshorea leprosula]